MSKKPDYTKSPALAFISSAQPAEQDNTQEAAKAPEGMKLNPAYIEKYIEKRTRRVQIVLQPSLYERAKAKAESCGKSFNDYIHELLENDVK
jgi:predicted DNA binding CopG/RHH family protein